jgi:DNA topoisomerase VI subunit A
MTDGACAGIEIMATYTLGSKSRAHERDVLACAGLRWLGVHSSDIEYYQVALI